MFEANAIYQTNVKETEQRDFSDTQNMFQFQMQDIEDVIRHQLAQLALL